MAFWSSNSPNQENDYTTGTFIDLLPSYAQTISQWVDSIKKNEYSGGDYEIQVHSAQHQFTHHLDLDISSTNFSIC
jgi:hypothetical protein